MAAIDARILGIPVDRPSVRSSSLRNSPIRRLRYRLATIRSPASCSRRIDGSSILDTTASSASPSPMGEWLRGLLGRAHKNKVVVALAGKLARIAWAILRSGDSYAKEGRPAMA